MTSEELRDLGRQIARDVAAGLMQATAAGAAEFCREMADAARAAESDGLLELAERIDAEKAGLARQIEGATGLKRLALQRRLEQLGSAEARMCEQVSGRAALPAPAPAEAGPGEVAVRPHVRRRVGANGRG
jgi:hypothetical protein